MDPAAHPKMTQQVVTGRGNALVPPRFWQMTAEAGAEEPEIRYQTNGDSHIPGSTAPSRGAYDRQARAQRGPVSFPLAPWSFDPFVVAAVSSPPGTRSALPAWPGAPEQTRRRRRRSAWFYACFAVLVLSVASPIDYWTYDYFYIHTIQHVLLMFAAPPLVVAGASWEPLLNAPGSLPSRAVRGATRGVGQPRCARP